VAPTVLEILEIEVPEGMRGRSMLAALTSFR